MTTAVGQDGQIYVQYYVGSRWIVWATQTFISSNSADIDAIKTFGDSFMQQ